MNLKISVLIIFCGVLAYTISYFYPPFDALFLALIFGIFVGNFFDENKIKEAERILRITLPIGIAMYGVNIKNPQTHLSYITIATLSTFILSLFVYIASRVFNLNNRLGVLLSCGTAICGASAIAIVASIIKPKKEEFSTAVIVITIVGLTASLILPYLYHVLSLPIEKYAILCGATLHQTGLVEIATKPFGYKVVKVALSVKGVRIALIAVVAFIVSLTHSEHRYYVPWYIAAFLVISYISNFILSEKIVSILKPVSTVAFSITLASVGFSVNVKDIQRMRLDPLIAAYSGWLVGFFLIFVAVTLYGW